VIWNKITNQVLFVWKQKPIGGVAVLPPINFTKEKKKEKVKEAIEQVEVIDEPPKKEKRKKDKEAVALTTELTNGSNDVTPSKKKVF